MEGNNRFRLGLIELEGQWAILVEKDGVVGRIDLKLKRAPWTGDRDLQMIIDRRRMHNRKYKLLWEICTGEEKMVPAKRDAGEKKEKINEEASRVGKQGKRFTLSTLDGKEMLHGATQVLASYGTGIHVQQASMTDKRWLPGPGLLTGRENSAQPETATSKPISSFPLQRCHVFSPLGAHEDWPFGKRTRNLEVLPPGQT